MTRRLISALCTGAICARTLRSEFGQGLQAARRALAEAHPETRTVSPIPPPPAAPAAIAAARSKVALVGNHATFSRIMAALLTPAAQFSVAGCFPSAAAALDGLRASGARVALVELLLPDGCGIRCARQLRQAVPGLAAILVSHSAERELAPYAVAAGVHHWLIEAVSREQWLTTLQFGFCAEAQRACLPPLGPPAPVTGGASLNNNEQEVMKALARGMMHKEIAARLGWSDAREKRIQHSAYEKLNAHTRTDALNRWRRINAPPTAPAQ